MGGLLGFLRPGVGEVLGAIRGVVDSLHTSGEEKLRAQVELTKLEMSLQEKILAAETEWAKAQAEVIKSEAGGESWLQRNWRPILMLTFTFIIAWNFVFAPVFSLEAVPVPADMWELLKIGIGGYILGRSAEKVLPTVLKK